MTDIKVDYIDHMGNDLTVVNAARVSFDFARMFNQRTDSHAQVEIQALARHVSEIIEPLFPISWAALTK